MPGNYNVARQTREGGHEAVFHKTSPALLLMEYHRGLKKRLFRAALNGFAAGLDIFTHPFGGVACGQ
jgi:hypothetical protein